MKPFHRGESTVPLLRQVCCCSGFTSKVYGVNLSRFNICSREMENQFLNGNFGFLPLWHFQSKHGCLSDCWYWPNLGWIAWNFLDCHTQVVSPPYLVSPLHLGSPALSLATVTCLWWRAVKGYTYVSLFWRVASAGYHLVPGFNRRW